MADLATLQTRLEELQRAYHSGALSVEYEGKRITYKSSSEMREAIASLEAALGVVQGMSIAVRINKNW
jgi:hypothetical protein